VARPTCFPIPKSAASNFNPFRESGVAVLTMLSTVPAFLLTALLIELTPGPNMAYLLLISAVEGRKSGFATAFGIALGLALIGSAVALGLAATTSVSPLFFQLLRWAGAAYLCWIALEAWIGTREVSPGQVTAPAPPMRHFRRGLVTNILNPKAGLFFMTILPGFADPQAAIMPQAFALTAVYVAVATLVHLVLVLVSDQASVLLANDERKIIVRKLFAVSLLFVAIWFLLHTNA
jgi:threonine/homoserine/homoserine lactone efflux protein